MSHGECTHDPCSLFGGHQGVCSDGVDRQIVPPRVTVLVDLDTLMTLPGAGVYVSRIGADTAGTLGRRLSDSTEAVKGARNA